MKGLFFSVPFSLNSVEKLLGDPVTLAVSGCVYKAVRSVFREQIVSTLVRVVFLGEPGLSR